MKTGKKLLSILLSLMLALGAVAVGSVPAAAETSICAGVFNNLSEELPPATTYYYKVLAAGFDGTVETVYLKAVKATDRLDVYDSTDLEELRTGMFVSTNFDGSFTYDAGAHIETWTISLTGYSRYSSMSSLSPLSFPYAQKFPNLGAGLPESTVNYYKVNAIRSDSKLPETVYLKAVKYNDDMESGLNVYEGDSTGSYSDVVSEAFKADISAWTYADREETWTFYLKTNQEGIHPNPYSGIVSFSPLCATATATQIWDARDESGNYKAVNAQTVVKYRITGGSGDYFDFWVKKVINQSDSFLQVSFSEDSYDYKDKNAVSDDGMTVNALLNPATGNTSPEEWIITVTGLDQNDGNGKLCEYKIDQTDINSTQFWSTEETKLVRTVNGEPFPDDNYEVTISYKLMLASGNSEYGILQIDETILNSEVKSLTVKGLTGENGYVYTTVAGAVSNVVLQNADVESNRIYFDNNSVIRLSDFTGSADGVTVNFNIGRDNGSASVTIKLTPSGRMTYEFDNLPTTSFLPAAPDDSGMQEPIAVEQYYVSEEPLSAVDSRIVSKKLMPIDSYGALLEFAERVNHGETDLNAKLMNDIEAEASAYNKPWTPIGDYDHRYTGVFDGCGYRILNLTFNDSSASYAGLFGYVKGVKDGGKTVGGVVKNVCLEDGNITGEYYVGGVVGYLYNGTVSDCINKSDVSGSYSVGGVVGKNEKGTITNCSDTGDISGDSYAGGVVGMNENGTISYCSNSGKVKATGSLTQAGGIAGYNYSKGIVANCYNTGDISGVFSVGGVVGYSDNSEINNCYNTGDVSGNYFVGGVAGCNDMEAEINSCYNTGDIKATDNYALAGGVVGRNIASVKNCYSAGSVTVSETASGVTLSGVAGKIDDYGTVECCYYDKTVCRNTGAVNGADDESNHVKGLTTAEMTAGTYTDGVVTNMPGFKAWSEDSTDGDAVWLVRESDKFASYYPHLKGFEYDKTGVVGDWPAHILKNGPYELENYSELRNFASVVNTEEPSACAKLMNDIDASSSAQANNWIPIGSGEYIEETGSNISYTGTFDGDGHVIAGLTFNDSSAGYEGLFGEVGEGGNVKNVGLEGGKITGYCFVGGVAGFNDGTITNCYNTSSVSGDYTGGVAGLNGGTVINCYNTGSVSGNYYAGGVVGYNNGFGTVKNCYSTGNVSGDENVGGVVGTNDGAIKNCYGTGSVSGNEYVGGVAGLNNNTITNCCYDKSVCGDIGAVNGSDSDTVKGLTTAQMTGADALSDDNIKFVFSESESNPWLVKENHCQNDFYPHLTGFAYDTAQTAENWPPKTDTGTGGHKYGETGDDRFTCTVCGQVDDDLKAAAELADAKETAKTSLENYKDAADYRPAQQTELSNAIAAGKQAIDNATDTAGVDSALTNAKAAIDAIKTDAQLTADELALEKASAKLELNNYKDASDYRPAQQTELSNAISAGEQAIDNATDTAGVDSALANAKAAIDNIKTDAQLTADELALEKASAKLELNNYKDAADYRPAQQTELSNAIAAGEQAIDNATDTAGVDSALTNAKAAIDAIKTDAELTAEELDAAKTAAKQELDEYKNPADYRDNEKAALSDAIAAGKDAIDNAADTDGVATALADAKAAIDAIKTDDELTAEELEADKKAFDEYKEDKKDEIDALAREGDSEATKALIDKAKDEIDALGYDEDKTLDENKAAADAIISKLKDDLAERRKEYTAKFIADGKTVKEEKFTIETEKLDEPKVPAKDGYEGKWSEYKLAASDIEINAVYTPVEYTATFVADGKTVKEVKYTVETKSIEAPEVPAKEGYTGEWEDYKLAVGGITVNAVYTENENPEPEDLCPLDEKDHGDSFFGKLVRFIHTIIWKLFRLFGMNIYFRIG